MVVVVVGMPEIEREGTADTKQDEFFALGIIEIAFGSVGLNIPVCSIQLYTLKLSK